MLPNDREERESSPAGQNYQSIWVWYLLTPSCSMLINWRKNKIKEASAELDLVNHTCFKTMLSSLLRIILSNQVQCEHGTFSAIFGPV